MTYKPPKTEAEKLREGARQLRRRDLLENWFYPKMLKTLQKIGRDAANAYLEGGKERALAEVNAHRVQVEDQLFRFYERAVDSTAGTLKFSMPLTRRKDFAGALDRISNFFRQFAFDQSKLITETSRKEVADTIEKAIVDAESENEVAKQIQSKVDTLSIGRARTIARTEALTATATTQDELIRDLGISIRTKEWVARLDSRTRDDHRDADGQIVGIDENFNVGGEAMRYPGDRRGGADQICNCRCVTVYDTDMDDF